MDDQRRTGFAELRRILERRPGASEASPGVRPLAESCELCGAGIDPDHQHLVDLDTRSLLCACRPCYLLFLSPSAGGLRYRGVPHRYLKSAAPRISDAQWDALQIPISIAFFFQNSRAERMVAFYPSPAGATESLLPLEPWQRIADENPFVRAIEPDVEAVLLRRRESGFDAFVVPIDSCYELVGRLRRTWKGFAGGEEAWAEIDAFFATLEARSEVVEERSESIAMHSTPDATSSVTPVEPSRETA